MAMREYQRRLPHQVPEGVPIFLTWNLKEALPSEVVKRLRRERQRLDQQPIRAGETKHERALRHGKLVFALTDEFLDRADNGPLHLRDAAAAKIVEDSILFGIGERYEVFAWCVVANHVHVLLKPLWELSKVTQGIKGYTAHAINLLHGEVGRTFWQDESYDHWVRDEEELLRIIHYIENNPVKAGLCANPQDWRWSSARYRSNWPIGQPYGMPSVVTTIGLSG